MIRKLIVIGCCVMLFLPGMAQNRTKKKVADSWQSAVVNLKKEVREGKFPGSIQIGRAHV